MTLLNISVPGDDEATPPFLCEVTVMLQLTRTPATAPFNDRTAAGGLLASQLMAYANEPDAIVLGLPRGGVPVAAEVAVALGAPLDVIVVRKLGLPFQPEVAFGAIGEDGSRVVRRDVIDMSRISELEISKVEDRERIELARRVERFRRGRPPQSLHGKVAIIVDDGIATGSTARAACQVARARGAKRVVLAVPVAPQDWSKRLDECADEFVCVWTPPVFHAVGEHYRDFGQTPDDEVVAALERVASHSDESDGDSLVRDDDVWASGGDVRLAGHLTVPALARGLVVFAHGTGSSRHSPRNRLVAGLLNRSGWATLLFDLLTPEEEIDRAAVLDAELLADRLTHVTQWTRSQAELRNLPVGYFGSSTGAAAALLAAAAANIDPVQPEATVPIFAVVSRGGRVDLAERAIVELDVPVLLVVGTDDVPTLAINERAAAACNAASRLTTIPAAGQLFDEPGALRSVAHLADEWFNQHVSGHDTDSGSPSAPAGDESFAETPWEFNYGDDEDVGDERSIEEQALHIEPPPRLAVEDPETPKSTARYFPDEEPEADTAGAVLAPAAESPDVGKVLETQHYLPATESESS